MARFVHLTQGQGEPVRFSRGQGEALWVGTSGDPVYPSSSGKIVHVTNPDALPGHLRPGQIGTRDEFKP